MADIKNLCHINAPIEKVYDAVATINGLRNWWTTDESGETKDGDTIKFRFGQYGGPDFVVKEFNRKDSIVLNCIDGMEDWISTTLRFKLDTNEGKTRVRFEHAGWKTTDDFLHYVLLAGVVILKAFGLIAKQEKENHLEVIINKSKHYLQTKSNNIKIKLQ